MQNFLKGNEILQNSVGYERAITTLTTIKQRVVDQKFYEIPIAEYLPVVVGDGAWSADLLTYRDFSTGSDFETGIVNTGANNSRLAEADTAIDSVTVPVVNWAKSIGYSIIDLQMAAKSGNWSLVESKEKSRKKNWDLGLQKVSFLGSETQSDVKGLLTQTDVNSNTTTITKKISDMNATEFQAFVIAVIEDYRANVNRTAYPDIFVMPESDYNGLASVINENYQSKTKYQFLLEAFQLITRNPNFKILPLSYADQSVNADIAGLNKNRYALYRYDQDTLRMDVPVDYTTTVANSNNSFQWQSVAYGQFTGAKAYRNLEILYFDWAA